uniref:Kallmann syndrome 1b sequence n=1 Tax=Nothobranchius korthausae TaxID=1143690 RepID=A0A1A8ELF1_9TELE
MCISRAGLVLLCAVLVVALARRSSPEPEDVQDKINSARCSSRCLSLHMTQLTAAFRHIQSDQVLVWCESHRRCTQCLQPCKELWETRKVLSLKSCEKQTECVTSREFLASLRSSRQGDCPAPQRATGFAAACVESCSLDRDCPSLRKCCFNGCGHTCQAPANLYKGVPLKPRREINFTEDLEGRVKVAWVSKFNVSMEPVIYMLQSRWNIGIHPSEDQASPWATIAMMLSEHVVLSDLRPQRWYQFRVAAINSHGSRGFTTPSKHYISSKDPSPPEPPTNIRVSNQTLDWTASKLSPEFTERLPGSGATVAILLRWDPPREGDLPVHNYRITWMSRHKLPHQKRSHAVHKYTQELSKSETSSVLTRGAQSELWLEGLLPATSYILSIQTVAYWGQKRLKSHRSQLVFTTIAHADKDFSNELPSSSSSSSLPSSPSSPTHPDSPLNPITSETLLLEVAAPHYHDNQLQVKVFWKWPYRARQKSRGSYILQWHPHTCSTNLTNTGGTTTVQSTHHTIKGLQFACKYRVTVATKADPRSEAVAWVTTPACSSIRVRGVKALACKTESTERPLSSGKVILRPERLTADFQLVNDTLVTTFRWKMTHHVLDSAAVEGFQFTWTLQSELSRARDDARISQTQTVSPSERSVTVSGLQANSTYQLQLQVLTTGGRSGAAVSKTIHTPAINSTL